MSKKKHYKTIKEIKPEDNEENCKFMIAGYTQNDEKIKFFQEDHHFPDGTAPCAIYYSDQYDTINFVFEDFTIGFLSGNLIEQVGLMKFKRNQELN